jgi:hypothetical protein
MSIGAVTEVASLTGRGQPTAVRPEVLTALDVLNEHFHTDKFRQLPKIEESAFPPTVTSESLTSQRDASDDFGTTTGGHPSSGLGANRSACGFLAPLAMLDALLKEQLQKPGLGHAPAAAAAHLSPLLEETPFESGIHPPANEDLVRFHKYTARMMFGVQHQVQKNFSYKVCPALRETRDLTGLFPVNSWQIGPDLPSGSRNFSLLKRETA